MNRDQQQNKSQNRQKNKSQSWQQNESQNKQEIEKQSQQMIKKQNQQQLENQNYQQNRQKNQNNEYKVKSIRLSGNVSAPSSKSELHRILICAVLSDVETDILCDGISDDILATAGCLRSLGAEVDYISDRIIHIKPIKSNICDKLIKKDDVAQPIKLNCFESGSTLRFLLTIVTGLGIKSELKIGETLVGRPIEELADELCRHGARIEIDENIIKTDGRLLPGEYAIPGYISSQYVSSLLMALPLFGGESQIKVKGNIESESYIKMTEDVMSKFSVNVISEEKAEKSNSEVIYMIENNNSYKSPHMIATESDWSAASIWVAAGAISQSSIRIENLNLSSLQGDKKIISIAEDFGAKIEIEKRQLLNDKASESLDDDKYIHDEVDVIVPGSRNGLRGMCVDISQTPDLAPAVAVMGVAANGTTVIENASRLRTKESDRIKSIVEMVNNLGGSAVESGDCIIIKGSSGSLTGGIVNPQKDHRIAMAAAILSSICEDDVTIEDKDCVKKSYPRFWEDFEGLAGSK